MGTFVAVAVAVVDYHHARAVATAAMACLQMPAVVEGSLLLMMTTAAVQCQFECPLKHLDPRDPLHGHRVTTGAVVAGQEADQR